MEVPLIQGRSQKFRVQKNPIGFARSNSSPLTGLNQVSKPNSGRLLGDAVKISISDEAKATASAKELNNTAESSLFQKGSGESALERLANIASQILKLSDNIKDQNGSPQQAALEQELDSLKDQFNKITQGSEFKRIIEITNSVRQSLAMGASGESIARALSSETGLLGSRFIDLVGSGAFSNIEKFASSLSDISSLKFDKGFDPSIARSALSRSESALNSLSGFNPIAPKIKEASDATPVNEGVVIEEQETQFVIGSDIALAMKSYDSKGIIASAATGYGMDPNDIFKIMIRAPKEEKDSEEDKAKRGEAPESTFSE